MIDGDAAMYPVTWICQWVDYKVLYCRVSSLCLEDDGSVVCWVGEYNWFSIHAFWIYITLAYNLCLNHNSLITLLPLCPFESRLNSLDQIFFSNMLHMSHTERIVARSFIHRFAHPIYTKYIYQIKGIDLFGHLRQILLASPFQLLTIPLWVIYCCCTNHKQS